MSEVDSASAAHEPRTLLRVPSAGILACAAVVLALLVASWIVAARASSQRALVLEIERQGGDVTIWSAGPDWFARRISRDWQNGIGSLCEISGGMEFSDRELAWAASANSGNLIHLDLRQTEITDAGLVHVRGFPRLTRLDLASTNISGSGLRDLLPVETLKVLDLEKTDVNDDTIDCLVAFPNVETLTLSSTAVSDEGLQQVGRMSRVRVLRLDSTRITDEGLAGLSGLSSLQSLSLISNRISDDGLKHLAGFLSLETLMLGGTDVTQDGVEELKRSLPRCRIFR